MIASTSYESITTLGVGADCPLADLDYPTCYLCSRDESDGVEIEDAGFPSQRAWVCVPCKCGYVHQQALRDEYALESAGA